MVTSALARCGSPLAQKAGSHPEPTNRQCSRRVSSVIHWSPLTASRGILYAAPLRSSSHAPRRRVKRRQTGRHATLSGRWEAKRIPLGSAAHPPTSGSCGGTSTMTGATSCKSNRAGNRPALGLEALQCRFHLGLGVDSGIIVESAAVVLVVVGAEAPCLHGCHGRGAEAPVNRGAAAGAPDAAAPSVYRPGMSNRSKRAHCSVPGHGIGRTSGVHPAMRLGVSLGTEKRASRR